MQFCTVTPVIESVPPATPYTETTHPQPSITSPQRLPNPMPTFTITAPPNQGPRAFFRASSIFQPSTGTYVPFPEILTPTTPVSQQPMPVPLSTTTNSRLVTPATVLYTSAGNTFSVQSVPQQTETIFYALNQPSTPIPQYIIGKDTSNGLNTAFVFEPGYIDPQPRRSFIPSTYTVASLKRQLNKLEAENNRLRRENQEKYVELEEVTWNVQRQMED